MFATGRHRLPASGFTPRRLSRRVLSPFHVSWASRRPKPRAAPFPKEKGKPPCAAGPAWAWLDAQPIAPATPRSSGHNHATTPKAPTATHPHPAPTTPTKTHSFHHQGAAAGHHFITKQNQTRLSKQATATTSSSQEAKQQQGKTKKYSVGEKGMDSGMDHMPGSPLTTTLCDGSPTNQ